MYDLRRNDYDVANSVQVSSTAAVSAAVRELFTTTWPAEYFDKVAIAFEDFDKLFTGHMPGYHGVDTLYHDRQHSLDMTLAMARLLVGYERSVENRLRFGAERASMALVTSLFHDAGYIREYEDRQHSNGAEFTLYHVTRSARFLARYLPSIGMETWVPVATRIVHFTGYEIKLHMIQLAEPKDRKLGHLLGTADLIAQMADRCYLEKCRDRLYPEFVLGGIAATTNVDGSLRVRYSSGLDRETFVARLEGEFEHAYRFLECLFGGKNPYLEAIERNLGYLHRVLRTERWPMLRRNPPLFTSEDTQINQVRGLMLNRLKALWA
jgi:hypothetical protein